MQLRPPLSPGMARQRLAHRLTEMHERIFADKVFGAQDWKHHRNVAWRHRPETMVCLKAAAGLFWPLLMVVILSFGVVLYGEYAVPRGAPEIYNAFSEPYSMITFALSLLLVFKTNSSYARWWEARTIWGTILNWGRNLPCMVLAYAPCLHPGAVSGMTTEELVDQVRYVRAILRWTAAAPHVLRGHLRIHLYARPQDCAAHILSPSEVDWLSQWLNKPLGCAYALSWLVSQGIGSKLGPNQLVGIQDQIALYITQLGGCERIQRTPLPMAYTRHTSRFLMIYLAISPLLLWPYMKWATPVAAALIAFLLLGTENIGAQIEEPMHVLALDAICDGIEANVRDLEAMFLADLDSKACMEGAAQHKATMSDLFQRVAGGQVTSLQTALAAADTAPHSPASSSSSAPASPAELLDPAAIPPDSVKENGERLHHGIQLGPLHVGGGGGIEQGRWSGGWGGRPAGGVNGAGTQAAAIEAEDEAVLAAAASQEASRSRSQGLHSQLSLFPQPSHGLSSTGSVNAQQGHQGGGPPLHTRSTAQPLCTINEQTQLGPDGIPGGGVPAYATPFAGVPRSAAAAAAAYGGAGGRGAARMSWDAQQMMEEGLGDDMVVRLPPPTRRQSIGDRLRAWSLPLTQEWMGKRS